MDTYTLGVVAQFVIATSVFPYLLSIFRDTVKPNRFSWFIWSIIGVAFWVVTPEDADDVTKMLTVIFMINPMVVFLLTLFKGKYVKPNKLEKFSLAVGLFAILVWYFAKDYSGILPTVIAIIADLCALVPTLQFVFTSPDKEKPFAWIVFFLGTLIAILAIQNYNFESMLLPVYMASGSFLVVLPLVKYRLKMQIPVKNWIIWLVFTSLF